MIGNCTCRPYWICLMAELYLTPFLQVLTCKWSSPCSRRLFKKYPQLDSLTMHSDQGWHYQRAMYQMMLKKHDVTQSMSRKGNCLDNAMMENFFGLMKNELLYANKFESIENFERALRKYID